MRDRSGLLGSLWLTRFLVHHLFEVTPIDPVTYLAAAVLLVAVALAACLLPALRAVKISPTEALRAE